MKQPPPKGKPPRDWTWPAGLVGLFLVAAAWRWAYLARLSRTPFANSLNADSRIYWDWSESILRSGPLPESPFFLAPLYPYVLAAWRALGAGSVGQVLVLQALLGAAAVGLLADTTARLVGRPIALGVGILLAVFQSSTFFDGLVLPESLLFFLGGLIVWFIARTDWSRAPAGAYAAYGLLVAMLAQGRASHAVLLALVFPLAWARHSRTGHRLRAVALAVATFGICCLPSALANYRAAREPIPFTYNLGFNLYVGNNPEANGAYVDILGGSIPVPLEGTSPVTGGALDGRAFVLASEGLKLSPSESSAYWTRKAVQFAVAEPVRALSLAGRKLLLAFSRQPIPQIESMDSFARAAGPLGLPGLGTFGVLAILGLTGAAFAARHGPAGRWLIGYVLLLSLSLIPFFVTDRYRHHLIPALAPLGGIAIAGFVQALRSPTRAAVVRTTLAAALAAASVFAPIGLGHARTSEWVAMVDSSIRLLERGAHAEAAAGFARAEAALGDGRERAMSTSDRTHLAAFYFRFGIALEALGRREEAIARWERAAQLNPNDVGSLGRLSLIYESAGRAADAARVRSALEATPGGLGQLRLNEGWDAAGRGDVATAERLFGEAVHAAPDLSMAWYGLIRLYLQEGRLDRAAEALERGRLSGLDPLAADIFTCYLANRRGDRAGARRILQRLPVVVPTDPYLEGLLSSSRRALEGVSR